jgi:uncharacterized membrane protein YfcA
MADSIAARRVRPRATGRHGSAELPPRGAVIVVAVTLVALGAFTTEGAIGFGATVIAACIGAQLVPLDVLLPAFVPLNLVLSSYLVASGRRAVAWRILVTEVAAPVAAGAAVGLALFHLPARAHLALAFGVFVVALAALRLARPDAGSLGRGTRVALLALGGVAHGLFGTGGPMIVYVMRRRLVDKRAFRATLAVLWLVLNVAVLANFAAAGLYAGQVGRLGIGFALVIAPGLWLGERIHRALDAARFERAVWLLLLAAGAALVARSAWAG